MKTFLFLLALASLSANVSAQNTPFKFGVVLNPAISGILLKNEGVPKEVEATYKKVEHRAFAFYGCLFAQYAMNSSASIQAGFGYSQTGYATDKQPLIFAQPEPSAPEYAGFSYTHQDVLVPVLFRYNLTKRKHKFYLIGGPTAQIKLHRTKTQTLEYADGRTTSTKAKDNSTDYRRLGFNGTVGVGYDVKIGKKTSVFFQPTFDCNLPGTSKSASLNRKIYSIGLNIGMLIG